MVWVRFSHRLYSEFVFVDLCLWLGEKRGLRWPLDLWCLWCPVQSYLNPVIQSCCVDFFPRKNSLTDCIIKLEKESEMDQPPPGVLLKNMTPCEEIKALISGHVCTILGNVRCLDCQQVEWVKQKSHNKCTLWPLATKSQKQVHRRTAQLPGDSCFVFEKHIRTFSWLQGGPACRTLRIFQWSRDPFRLLVKRVRASYRSYFLKQEARGLIVREEKEGTASSSYPWQRAHN